MIKVAIIEDNASLRSSLVSLLNRSEFIRCVAALANLHNVVTDISKSSPDIILMDIGLPDISGIEGVRMIRQNFPHIDVLIFTVFEEEEKIFEAIREGASGYLLKKTAPEQIINCILELYHGGAPMSASIARKVVQSFHQPPTPLKEYELTGREKDVLYGLIDGLSYKKIAEKHHVSVSTVRTHISSVYQKLHVKTKSQAVAKVLQQKNNETSP